MTTLIAALSMLSVGAPPQNPARMQVIWDAFDNRINTQTDVWFEDGEFPRVIQTLRVMYSLYPSDFEIATNLGWMLENIEENQQALATYQQYRKDNPKDPDAAYPEANYYFMKRQFAKIPAILEPSIKMATKPHANNYRRLAHAYERLDKLEDSKRVWEIYIKLNPDDAPAKNNLKRVQDKLKAKAAGR